MSFARVPRNAPPRSYDLTAAKFGKLRLRGGQVVSLTGVDPSLFEVFRTAGLEVHERAVIERQPVAPAPVEEAPVAPRKRRTDSERILPLPRKARPRAQPAEAPPAEVAPVGDVQSGEVEDAPVLEADAAPSEG